MTLPKLSEEAKIAKGYLWELENDKAANPSAATLFRIAAALGTTVADLLGEAIRPPHLTDIPESLKELAKSEQLTDDDIEMLAGISYRGERPRTVEDWKFVLESIRRSVKRRPSQTLKHSRNRRTWRSEEARELMQVTGASDPVTAIRTLASNLLVKGEQVGPPVDLPLLASLQNILRIEATALREAGRLIPTREGLVVQVKESDSEGRRNFTVAHELGHTLLPSYRRQPAFRNEVTVGAFASGNEEEYLCDVAASAILLPEAWLRPQATERGRHLAAVSEIAQQFRSSLEATALAWTQLDLWPVAVVVWEEALKPAERRALAQPGLPGFTNDPPVPKFRISRSFRSPSFPYFLPKHKSVDDNSVIGLAVEKGEAKGILGIEVGSTTFEMECEALHAPYRQGEATISRVIAMVTTQ